MLISILKEMPDMGRYVLAALLAGMILISGCVQSREDMVSAVLGNQFQLKPGQTAFLASENLKISFLNVTGDSRCPSDVKCVVRGAATIEVEADKGSEDLGKFEISDYDTSTVKSTATVGEYSVKLAGIEPYPKSYKTPLKLTEYVATLVISKALHEGPAEPEEKEVAFETIRNGVYSAWPERKMYVITNSTEWDVLKRDLNYLRTIDFGKDMLVAVFLGERSSGGYGIEVSRIIETQDAVEVTVIEASPGSGCPVTLALTQPYHIVKIRKTDKRVIFNIEEYTAEKCK